MYPKNLPWNMLFAYKVNENIGHSVSMEMLRPAVELPLAPLGCVPQ